MALGFQLRLGDAAKHHDRTVSLEQRHVGVDVVVGGNSVENDVDGRCKETGAASAEFAGTRTGSDKSIVALGTSPSEHSFHNSFNCSVGSYPGGVGKS